MGLAEIRQQCSKGIVIDSDDGEVYTVWDLDTFLDLITDKACKWLEKNQSKYIQKRSDGTTYVSGSCLTNLRAHLQEL